MKTESNTKQSSVDWIIGEIIKHQMTFYGTSSMPLRIIEQAKVMHKEECEQSYMVNRFDYMLVKDFEEYYSKTYTNERV
jgi:hypothetical protein